MAGRRTGDGPDAPPRPAWTTRRRFLGVLLLITVAAAGLRITYVVAVTRHQDQLFGDQVAYARVAETLADGQGFRDPFILDRTLPNADHPPLTSILVTPAYLLFDRRDGADTAARLIMALIGAATVFAIGLAARRVVVNVEVDPDSPRARRVGWIAAGVAAVAPGLWLHDGLIMSEGPGALTIALVIWAAVRALDRPGALRMGVLGGAIGLACLARAEAVVLVPLLIVPVAFTRRGDRTLRRGRSSISWLVAGAAGLVIVLAPWVVPNLLRFEEPTFISTTDGGGFAGSNCREAYHGPTIGLWIRSCQADAALASPADASVNNVHLRSVGLRYARNHLGALPRVLIARELRTWSAWSPRQEVYLNSGEGDEAWVSWSAMVVAWGLMIAGAAGMVILYRRDRPVWPLVVNLVAVTITSAAFYGLARFRVGADVAFVVASGVAFEALLLRRRSG